MTTAVDHDVVAVPREPHGPFGSPLAVPLGLLPGAVRRPVAEVGGMSRLLVVALASAVRHPRGYWGEVALDMRDTIQRSWLAITVALSAFLVALSIPAVQFVSNAGVAELYGPLLIVTSTRTFTVWVAALLMAGVVGASATAELGARKVREELDAMNVMGIDPVRALVVPRIVSITLMTTLLAVPAEVITLLTAQFAAWYVAGINAPQFYSFVWLNLGPTELAALVVNCALSGLLIATVCCYKGLHASGGSIGLGRAVNQAVVQCFLAIFAMQLGFNAILLGLFPGLGEFK
ncbi:MAG TPA: ABC transporter permease [Nocardioides sp.]|nr:ABC transporter permease [Nocardioides sp.]